MPIVNVNGSPIVYNNALVYINGSSDGEGVNGYIQAITYRRGNSSAHVQTLDPNGDPLTVNRVNSSPNGTITFAQGTFQYFYELLNSRNVRFDLAFVNYETGQLAGSTHTSQVQGCMLDDIDVQTAPMQPNSIVTLKFNARTVDF